MNDAARLALVSGSSALAVLLLMLLVAALARRLGRISIIDAIWGPAFVVVAALAVTVGAAGGAGHDPRRWLLLVLVTAWGGRLGWHLARRLHGAGEDPRYRELLANGPGGVVRKVLLPQGLAVWFVSLPVQVVAAVPGDLGVLSVLGAAVWALGMVFESVGDAQLAAYKRDPDRGPVMDRGLWAWTRHPNYFGDACVWWGIWLIAADSWPGVLTVLSPAAMTYFLVFATGARLLERTMMKRPGYPEYAARTPMFLPRPPRRRRA